MSSRKRSRRASSPAKGEPLTPGRIVDAALAVIDREGLEAFSTRKLGAELGCEAMSIYYHFASKGELLDAIASRLLDELELPGPEAGAPRERLRACICSYRAIAQKHPDAFPLLALRRLNSPQAFRMMEWLFALFTELGFDAKGRVFVFRLVGHWLTGATLSELAARARIPHTTRTVTAEEMDVARYPLVTASTRFLMADGFDELFARELEHMLALIDGLPRC